MILWKVEIQCNVMQQTRSNFETSFNWRNFMDISTKAWCKLVTKINFKWWYKQLEAENNNQSIETSMQMRYKEEGEKPRMPMRTRTTTTREKEGKKKVMEIWIPNEMQVIRRRNCDMMMQTRTRWRGQRILEIKMWCNPQ